MKKNFTRWLTALLACVLLWPLLVQPAEAAEATLSGATSLRAGNSVTVTFAISGSGLLAIDADLSYDSDALELLGSKQLMGSGWDMQQNGNKFILYDTQQTNPIEGSEKVFSVTFRVKSGVDIGRKVSASLSGTTSDGSAESAFSASWSATIQAPLSSDAKLKDLRCANATLDFTGATEYHITVPYAVSSLELDWDRSHSAAEVSVSGNKLRVGSNTVTITVTAENGNIKRYYLYVKRQQDPSYTPGTDALLKSLQVSAGTLSPAFAPEICEYVLYLPNETTRLELTGVARDSKAQGVQQIGSSDLPEGTTTLTMRCTAEDGTTTQDYQIHVVRMPAFTGTLPEILVPEETVEPTAPLPPAEPQPEPKPTLELPLAIPLPYLCNVSIWWVAGAALALLLLLVWLLAWLMGRRSGRKKALRQRQAQTTTPAAQEETPTAGKATRKTAEEAPAAPVEEVRSEEASPAEDTPPAQEEVPTGEDVLFVEDRPFTREEPTQEPPAPTQPHPSKPLDELDGMSLDDLLEDIRNM